MNPKNESIIPKIMTRADGLGTPNASLIMERQQKFVTKTLLSLVAGDRFTAVVRDIRPGYLTLTLADGSQLDARTIVMPEARIGDEVIFVVKENVRGQLLLELARSSETKPVVGAGVLRDALAAAEMPETTENVRLVGQLIHHHAPIHAEALRNAAYFMFTEPSITPKQLAFLVKENMPPSERTLALFHAQSAWTRRLTRLRSLLKGKQLKYEKKLWILHC